MFQMGSIILLHQPLTTVIRYHLFVKKLARGKGFWGIREDVKANNKDTRCPWMYVLLYKQAVAVSQAKLWKFFILAQNQLILMIFFFFFWAWREIFWLLEIKELSTVVETLTFPNVTFDHVDIKAILKWMQQLTLL